MNPLNEILLYGPIGPDFWEPENAITAKSVMSRCAFRPVVVTSTKASTL